MCARIVHTEINPELLQRRLNAVDDAATRRWAEAITKAALDCLVRLQGVALADLEQKADDFSAMALWSGFSDQISAIWGSLEGLQQQMQPLVDAYEFSQGGTDDLDFFGDEAPADVSSKGVASPPGKGELSLEGPLRRIAETSWAMAFMLSGEVKAFRNRISYLLKQTDGWELLGDAEDHLGRLRSGVVALLNGVHACLPAVGEEDEVDQNFDVTAARDLRTRVFQLRDDVLDLEQQMKQVSPGDWRPFLESVRDRVEKFVFGPAFAWMRAGDKSTFLRQRQTLTEILELWSPLRAEPARVAVDALARFLEAMEVLNQRETLTNHDRQALCLVVNSLDRSLAATAPDDCRAAIGAALAALSEAQGRDRVLDELLAQTMEPGSEIPVAAILARAREVLAGLGGG